VLALTSGDATRARGYGEEQARFRAEQEAAIVRILAEGRAQGTFPWADPEPDARSIRAAIGQAFDDQMTGTARVTAAEAAAQVTGFALRALGAGPDTAPTDESAVSSP
jgi:regulator of protease activity HflC (stomatin/prohibitin superfamily)